MHPSPLGKLDDFTKTTASQQLHCARTTCKNRLALITFTEEFETEIYHIIESIHRFINSVTTREPLPRKLYLQKDNCTRENKNGYLSGYIEYLLAWNIFYEIMCLSYPLVILTKKLVKHFRAQHVTSDQIMPVH